ncbi:MAG: universal stress protein [Thermoplasmata archaeon]|nr:MAG: universal stress protein [Thermoplasmata archaeon]
MFKNILIPISSEFYPKHVLERGIYLAEKLQSKLTIIYIIEEKTITKAINLIKTYRTPQEVTEIKKEIIKQHKQTAAKIIFNDIHQLTKNKNITIKEKITEGEFSETIQKETKLNQYDLILMGFEKECLLKYRIIEETTTPIWIDAGYEPDTILVICSNLAPNQKAPHLSIKLSKTLNWKLQMLYIVDTEDTVQVNKHGQRSDKKPEKTLLLHGQKFIKKIEKKGIKAQLIKGSLEKETIKAAEKTKTPLIIIGREQKKKGKLGLPVKNLKKKLVEKCNYSILFLR